MATALDDRVLRLIGVPQYAAGPGIAANPVNVRAMCAAVENGNPVHWDDQAASGLLGDAYCPATMLPAWGRPEYWEPGQGAPLKALQAHFDLKDLLGYPASIVVSYTISFHAPVRIGDRLHTRQVVREVGDPKRTRLGFGRFWTIEMQYLDDDGGLVGVERYEFFGFEKAGS